MKVTAKQLQKLIREAVEEALDEETTTGKPLEEDYAPGRYNAPHEISGKYGEALATKLGVKGNMQARKMIIDMMTTAVNDAWQSGQEG